MAANDTKKPLVEDIFYLDRKLYDISGVSFDDETILWAVRDYRLAQRFPLTCEKAEFSGEPSWKYKSSDNGSTLSSHHLRVVFVACVFAALRRRAFDAMTWSMSCTLLRSLTTESTAEFLGRVAEEDEGCVWRNTSWLLLLHLPISIFTMILAFPSALWATDEEKTLGSRGAIFFRALSGNVYVPLYAVVNLLVGLVMLVPTLLAGTTFVITTMLEYLTVWPVSQCLLPNVDKSITVDYPKATQAYNPIHGPSIPSPLEVAAPRRLFGLFMSCLHGDKFTRDDYPEAYAFYHPG